ncbi:Htur_1727 family rSAM-partnered candidate RiPP [Haloarcula salinisoli]|uniref:Htur_1727 family rSAM-partnered candidate RiPP n=1 Tax=Haloarcula salinisoli TaxID=2487746 RepID=A0A8J7YHW4_9EURY|nr:Htur_1727 family rSAM-partnered candidate RiPP [Halomicroarcula salinisoli]MBX0284774.1 Htur_1727 family rSAM-partnered candidate RiPP [Halomicroarcula salinisoli]MBX0303768.1 Htur_1727 family rSAM-partnered candidate RiPP [Halomicroarcula salinisoli]
MDTLETVDAPRGDTTREWEVFCRETESEPLTHVGSVSAPTAAVARDQAATLFGHAATALWLCPADETVRVQEQALGVGETTAAEPDDSESAPTMDEDRMNAETLRGEAE